MLLQWLIGFVILFAWLSVIVKLRNKKITLGEFLLWSLLWGSLFILSIFPQISTEISKLLGVGRGVDVIIYGSLFLLFFLMFKLYVKMEEQERQTTFLVRELAIRRSRKK